VGEREREEAVRGRVPSLQTTAATARDNGAILSMSAGDVVTVELANTHNMTLYENRYGYATAFYGMLLSPDV
jgi:hypothetical protein